MFFIQKASLFAHFAQLVYKGNKTSGIFRYRSQLLTTKQSELLSNDAINCQRVMKATFTVFLSIHSFVYYYVSRKLADLFIASIATKESLYCKLANI